MFERGKEVHALDRAASVIGCQLLSRHTYLYPSVTDDWTYICMEGVKLSTKLQQKTPKENTHIQGIKVTLRGG
jgi:hypothetical protein